MPSVHVSDVLLLFNHLTVSLSAYVSLWLSKCAHHAKMTTQNWRKQMCAHVCVYDCLQGPVENWLWVVMSCFGQHAVELGLVSAAFPPRCEGQLSHNLQHTTRTIQFPRPQQSRTQPHPAPQAPGPSQEEHKKKKKNTWTKTNKTFQSQQQPQTTNLKH